MSFPAMPMKSAYCGPHGLNDDGCGGPHAANTGDLKSFKIKKEEASSAGVRRIKAELRPQSESADGKEN